MPADPPPENSAAQDRLKAVAARVRLGRPLAELAQAGAGSAGGRMRPLMIVGSMLGTIGGVGLGLAWLESSMVWLGGGGALSLAATAMLWRARARPEPSQAAAVPLLDDAALRRLDDALATIVAELDDATAADLMEVKAVIARLAAYRPTVNEHFTMDDRMYVVECVRRYLPDSLKSYLAVPREHRQAPTVAEGQTAAAMLREQLQLLCAGLRQREERAARGAAGQLLRQQRFLATKR
jgi:hypothetical protein